MWETDFLIDKTQKAQLDTERHICIDTESQPASLINNINISHLRAIVCKYMQNKNSHHCVACEYLYHCTFNQWAQFNKP